jgi:DNA-binding MarR family transcriptional regulator
MTEVKGDYPDHIVSLFGLVMDAVRRELSAEMGRTAPAAVRGLRSSQVRLLSLTPREGMRVTDLAERVGMTKQALGEFANDLEERGLIESLRDPHDRRVRILRPTRRGLAAVAAADEVIGRLEDRWRERLGPREWQRLRRSLTILHNDAEERRTQAPQ